MSLSSEAVAATAGGGWLVAAVVVPVVALLLAVAGGARNAARVGVLALPVGVAIAVAVALGVARQGALGYHVGGWAPPLGIALQADMLSAAMLVATAIVTSGAGLYALADFGPPREPNGGRQTLGFWVSLLGAWAADAPKIDVWLGYDHHLIPVRIRATDIGGRVLDQLLAR